MRRNPGVSSRWLWAATLAVLAAVSAVVVASTRARTLESVLPRGEVHGALQPIRRAEPPDRAIARLQRDLLALDEALARIPGLTVAGRRAARGPDAVRRSYTDARAAYKREEALVEVLAPAAAAALNGRRQEVDDDDEVPPGTTASTFAALEDALAARGTRPAAAGNRRAIAMAVDAGRAAIRTLLAQSGELRLSAPLAFEAAHLEVARVATLGVTGFDTPATRAGVTEAAVALRGAGALVVAVTPATPARTRALAALERAARYAARHPDFARFDRVTFIAEYTEPALRALEVARVAAAVPLVQRPRAWVGTTLFERDAFSPRAYAPESAPRATPALVALGARLFADPALSGDGSRACASCHEPARAFTDGRRAPLASRGAALHAGAHGTGTRLHVTLRNAPSLLQAAYEPALFADARAVTLEDQAAVVLASPTKWRAAQIAPQPRSRSVPAYVSAFRTALGGPPTPLGVRQALAAYVRSLGRTESRVDFAFRGNRESLTHEERRGASLFLGRAGCGTCHYAPLFAGASPPLYRSVDAEVLGVPAVDGNRLDPDLGRGAIDGRPEHAHAFKTPTLRNIARTAPYMHNGVFRTLDAVVRFYDDGGGRGRGLDVPNQTLLARPLHLCAAERHALVAFLRALSDTAVDGHRRR